jgi:type I restriction enzyme, S subunit
MADEPPRMRLAELCEQIVDCPHSTPLWTESGVLVLRNQNIRNGRLDLSSPSFTDEHHFEQRSRRARLRAGDLVITREAPMGEVCMIPEDLRCCLGQRMVMLRADPRKCHARFLLYAIQSSTVQHEIKVNEGTGSTVSNLRIPLLEALPIPYPPLPEQRAIASVLGALDDKIDLNRRMCQTLEEMARALFKSWFVDFDPVRAKMEGRNPGLPKEIADLFPSRLVDSELGPIPEGWRVAAIEELATIRGGKQLPTESCGPVGDVPVFGANGVMGYTSEASHYGFVIAFGRVGAYCGAIHWRLDHAWINNNASAVVPIRWPTLVLSLMLNIDFAALRTGSAQPFIPNSALAAARVIAPHQPVADAFCAAAEPLRQLQATLADQSRTLAALRDTLLPKLISGELRVPASLGSMQEVAT